MLKPFTVWITTNWKILKEMGIPDQLTCLLRNLHAGQESTVRTGHGTIDWLQIGKGVRQGCTLSRCLFNLYAQYIMRNAGMDEAQAGIKILGKITITSDTKMTPSLWQKLKRNYRASWWRWNRGMEKLAENSAFKKLRSWLWSHHFMVNRWENNGNSDKFCFFGLQNLCRWWLKPWN